MTVDTYLKSVLSKYYVPTGILSPAYKAYEKLTPIIKNWGGKYVLTVDLSGSYAKGTVIKGGPDVDLFISIDSQIPDEWTLEKLYNSLYNKMNSYGYTPRKQDVSIGITVDGVSVDLVPAKKLPGNTNDHWLWRNKKQTRIQTNITKQIDNVKNSNKIDEIKLTKIWKVCKNVDIPSVYLELSVIEALWGKIAGRLEENMRTVLQYFRDNFQTKRIVDPGNTNNIISDELTPLDKSIVSVKASASLLSPWNEIIK